MTTPFFFIMSDINYSASDFQSDCAKICRRISNLQKKQGKYDYIHGVPRGGVPLATWISAKLGIKIVESYNPKIKPKHKILVVDDVIDSGKTRLKYEKHDFICLHRKKHAEATATYTAHDNMDPVWINYWWEENEEKSIDEHIIRQLEFIGEDPNREGLVETPTRVINSWKEIFAGYEQDPANLLTTFDAVNYDEIILLCNIELYSTCEHHLLPFIGKAHVAYIPGPKIIGISKLARLVEIYARRLQIQERIGSQVTRFLMDQLRTVGAACIIEAQHLCMQMRGVAKQNSIMKTSSLEGAFRHDQRARAELMSLIK